jgi:hypothetical protein
VVALPRSRARYWLPWLALLLPAHSESFAQYRCCASRCRYGDCGHSSITSAARATHELSHTGVRPYACSMCPYRSRQKCTLVAHEQRHIKRGDMPGVFIAEPTVDAEDEENTEDDDDGGFMDELPVAVPAKRRRSVADTHGADSADDTVASPESAVSDGTVTGTAKPGGALLKIRVSKAMMAGSKSVASGCASDTSRAANLSSAPPSHTAVSGPMISDSEYDTTHSHPSTDLQSESEGDD